MHIFSIAISEGIVKSIGREQHFFVGKMTMGCIEVRFTSLTTRRISVMTPVVQFEIPFEIGELSRNITGPLMQMLTSSSKLVYCLKDFAVR